MNRKLAPVVYIGMVLVAVAIIFLLGGGITGMAVTELYENPLGTYEIYPNIKTDVGFSLDYYKQLRIDARKLIDTVKKCDKSITPTMDECIQASLDTLQLGWKLNCGRGQEGFFYDFAEFYQRCGESADDDCVCRMDYRQKSYEDGKYSVVLKQVGGRAVLESALMQSLEFDTVPAMQEVGGFANVNRDYGAMSFDLEYKGNLAASQLTLTENTAVNNRIDLNNMIFFRKQGKTLSLVVPNDQELYKEKSECSLPEKKVYIFCAAAEQVTATDPSGKASQKLLSYRFALEP